MASLFKYTWTCRCLCLVGGIYCEANDVGGVRIQVARRPQLVIGLKARRAYACDSCP